MNISLRQLQIFLAVVSTQNFSRAGESVGLSQPAVSRAVHELEVQLDLRLFDRTTREVVPTEAGEMLAQRLPRWMDELDNTLVELRNWAGSRRGKVHVASSPTISAHLMPYCLAECARKEPGLEVLLLDRIQQDVLSSVLASEVDFGVVVEPSASQLNNLHSECIMQDPFCMVLPQDHALAKDRAKSGQLQWKDLDDPSLILLDYASGSRRLIDDALSHYQIPHSVKYQVGHATTGFEMVRAGLGISIMPGLAIPAQGIPGLVVKQLAPMVQRRIMLIHRKNRDPSPLAQCLWALIRECAKETTERRNHLWQ